MLDESACERSPDGGRDEHGGARDVARRVGESGSRPVDDRPAGRPGPFSLADRDAIEMLLESAGFHDIEISAYEVPMLLGEGGTLDDALTFLLNTGAALAMFDGADPTAAEHATAAARPVLADHYDNDGVLLGAATWIVSAKVSS